MRKNYPNHEFDENSVYEGEVIDPIATRRSINALLSTRSGSVMLQNAMLEAGHDKCRAMMAQGVLQHTGILTMEAARMSALAPQSSRHYEAIIDAYAKKAVRQIERM